MSDAELQDCLTSGEAVLRQACSLPPVQHLDLPPAAESLCWFLRPQDIVAEPDPRAA